MTPLNPDPDPRTFVLTLGNGVTRHTRAEAEAMVRQLTEQLGGEHLARGLAESRLEELVKQSAAVGADREG